PGARDLISRDELTAWIQECDVAVTHAGVGSALTLFEAGRTPVMVPRGARRGEHVDDHQQLIARELSARGLAVVSTPEDLVWDDVVRATETVVERADPLPGPVDQGLLDGAVGNLTPRT